MTGGETRAGRAASDWAFLGDVPAVKIGPGDSGVSHRPDEDIDIEQVRRAARVYADLARRFAAGAAAA
ncbi:MAG: M20/M25/M40 family metallo-hydrolase [Deltaproteobacteria bacterium]|nr:M20/M25/M40 family metallo-hydrolase [Deltaproteobacteria bacterium]